MRLIDCRFANCGLQIVMESVHLGMLKLCLFLLLLPLFSTAQNNRLTATRIDHVPIVVKDIDAVKRLLADTLGFTVKEGRHHEGIYNCFTKFADGTYLEFVTPEDTSYQIGKFYNKFLQVRQGATAMAIAVNNADSAANRLQQQIIPFTRSANPVWKTIMPGGAYGLFFIEYADKNWKDTKTNTTHANTSKKLLHVSYATNNIDEAIELYRKLGFSNIVKIARHSSVSAIVAIGSNKLTLIHATEKSSDVYNFVQQFKEGIDGITIQVENINKLKTRLAANKVETINTGNEKSILLFLKHYNLFIQFTE